MEIKFLWQMFRQVPFFWFTKFRPYTEDVILCPQSNPCPCNFIHVPDVSSTWTVFPLNVAYCHISLKLRLSNIKSGQYLDRWPLRNTRCFKLRCIGCLMDNSLELLIGELNSNSHCVRFHLHANTFENGMNPPLLSTTMG